MILSDLVNYKSTVDRLSTNDIKEHVRQELDKILGDVNKNVNEFAIEYSELDSVADQILQNFKTFEKVLDELKKHLKSYVREQEIPYLQKSYQQYEESLKLDTPEYITDRYLFNQLIYKPEIKEEYSARIVMHSSWKYPGLIVRPEDGFFVDNMIASDPLYIADEHRDLFLLVKQKWNKTFQDRIRYKLFDESREEIYRDFPKNQFGLIVLTNFFNFKPFEIIKKHLIELKSLCRPGGVIIFTYNNCDYSSAVKNVENGLHSYTPGSIIEIMVIGLGFEILKSVNYSEYNVSWLEIKNPGELTSMRGGQSLAKIITKPGDAI